MPAYLNGWLLDSIVGDTEKLKREIYQNFDESVEKLFPRAIEEVRAEKADRIAAEKELVEQRKAEESEFKEHEKEVKR